MAERGDSLDDLIERVRGGDLTAREDVCRFYRPMLVAYVIQRMGEGVKRWTDPEDVVQQTLLEVLGRPDKLPPDLDKVGLAKKLKWTALRRIYDAGRRRRRDQGWSCLPQESFEPAARVRSVGAVTMRDTRRVLGKLLERLTPMDGEILRLCAEEQLTFVEVAERLGMSPDAVRMRFRRIRQRIRRWLGSR